MKQTTLQQHFPYLFPQMGVFALHCLVNDKIYVQSSENLTLAINTTIYQLNCNAHKSSELQNDWQLYGEQRFEVEILQNLDYRPDGEAFLNYTQKLSLMQQMWEERLMEKNLHFYL